MKRLLVSCLCMLFIAGSALAEDIQPPWWRGRWSTTSQYWEFSDPYDGYNQPYPDGLPPDGSPAGGEPWLPSTKLWVTPGPEPPWSDWMPEDQPYEYESGKWVGYGVWPLSGHIDVIVDNHNPPNEFKWVWVQLTWRPQDQGEVPIFTNLDPQPANPPALVAEEPLGNGWMESTYEWKIYPNPVDEGFRIEGTINMDELVIDTWCIPEPATVIILGLGGLFLRRRKR